MLKPQIISLLLLCAVFNFIPISTYAVSKSVKYHIDRRSRMVPIKKTNIYINNPNLKRKKYVYNSYTRKVTRAPAGKLLPSQVSVVSSRKISRGKPNQGHKLGVTLREKMKVKPNRSIASEKIRKPNR